ncbi:6753_t:CDS:2, partial [Ambispora leptoticha]
MVSCVAIVGNAKVEFRRSEVRTLREERTEVGIIGCAVKIECREREIDFCGSKDGVNLCENDDEVKVELRERRTEARFFEDEAEIEFCKDDEFEFREGRTEVGFCKDDVK